MATTSRDGLLGYNQTTDPGYATGDVSQSNAVSSEASFGAVLQKAQLGLLAKTLETDQFTAIQSAAAKIALEKGVSGTTAEIDAKIPGLGMLALNRAYSDGLITDTTFILLAPLGTPVPTSGGAQVVWGPWQTLSSAIAAISTVVANTVNRGAPVYLGTAEFSVPERKCVAICVEHRINRTASTAQTASAATTSTVRFDVDYSRVSAAAVADGKYKQTVAGMVSQWSETAVAAIAANTFQYRYKLILTDENQPASTAYNQNS